MNVSSIIAHRIAFNRQKSFSRFIIRLSVVATVISVATMIITLSFVNGFQETVSGKVFSFWGHVRVQARQPMKANISEEIPIESNNRLLQQIKKRGDVASIHPFATKYAILKTEEDMDGVLVKGLDSNYNFKHLSQFLQAGRWIRFTNNTYAREIVISTYTANTLHLKLNDRLLIYFVRPDGSLRPDKLTIVGFYKTGIEQYDKTFALGDLRLIRRLNNWQEAEIGGYEIFLKDYKNMDAVSEGIYNNAAFPTNWETQTVREIYPDIFDWLNITSYNGRILIVIVLVIVVINFITCLIILVLERVRMIGILKAVGASNWTIQKIFLYHSLFITFSGTLLGTGISLGLIWLQNKTGFVKLKEAEYYMQTAAVKIDWTQVAAVISGTLLVAFLVLLIPTLLVRKIQPIKAIRFT